MGFQTLNKCVKVVGLACAAHGQGNLDQLLQFLEALP